MFSDNLVPIKKKIIGLGLNPEDKKPIEQTSYLTYYKKNNYLRILFKKYIQSKQLYNNKIKRFPLLISVIDKTSYPFNGCKRVKRY